MKFLVKTRSQPLDGVTSERMWVQAQVPNNSIKHDLSAGSGHQALRTCGCSFGLDPRTVSFVEDFQWPQGYLGSSTAGDAVTAGVPGNIHCR